MASWFSYFSLTHVIIKFYLLIYYHYVFILVLIIIILVTIIFIIIIIIIIITIIIIIITIMCCLRSICASFVLHTILFDSHLCANPLSRLAPQIYGYIIHVPSITINKKKKNGKIYKCIKNISNKKK